MRIRITWNKPDGTEHAVEIPIGLSDPYLNDEEMQVEKAKAAARLHFFDRFGEFPEVNQLKAEILRD